jgi:predicted dienelactone hydrolase
MRAVRRRTLLKAFALSPGVLLAGTAAAAASPYAAAGPFAAAVGDLRWTDASRGRPLPLRLRLPAGQAPLAVVLFSHGLGGALSAGQFWAEHWASHGLAVIHLQHPGSDQSVWQGAPRPAEALRQAASGEQLAARVADVKFVLDELARRRVSTDPADAWVRRLDLERIGMSGHSFGAVTTQAIAGQAYGRGGAPLADPRPRAFIAFSPSSRAADAQEFAGITRPFLALTGTADGAVAPGLGVAPGQRRAVFDALPPGNKMLVWLTGADHMIFSGSPRIDRAASNTRPDPALDELHQRVVCAVSLAFWRAHLLDDAAARTWLQHEAAAFVGNSGEVLTR